MTNLNQQIIDKISNLSFKNGKKLVDTISNIIIKDGNIGFALDITDENREEAESLRRQAIDRLQNLPMVDKITIILTSNDDASSLKPPIKTKNLIEGVKKVILVAAGKGGVGKSTIAALFAQQLTLAGYKVGIADADIYGPSIPQIFGVAGKPEIVEKRMLPLESRNIQVMSIGFLTKDDSPIAWRGPMASKAIFQLLSLTLWNGLDYLIIDMPPGTGDIHLSILENYLLHGVIIVTTPQKLAAIDVKKAIELYQKFSLPILGLIENMSYFVDANNNKATIFSGNSGEYLAAKYNIPLICQLPFIPALAQACDQGENLTQFAHLPLEGVL